MTAPKRYTFDVMSAGVYLHIPFCKSRCSYCDFATDVYRSADAVERYVAALCREIRGFEFPETGAGRSADTIYFGGGTPSLLTPAQVATIISAIREKFDISLGSEITMEMNPATVTAESLRGFRDTGVNRASFGVQTFDDRALKLLARGHNADDARETFRLLRDSGFTNISLDLIAGLPGQTMDQWRRNLAEAIAIEPEHLSLYLLEIHEGTPLATQVSSGRQPTPDEDLAARMYEVMLDELSAAGYRQYEISNFAKPGFESRHNSKYWRLEPVYGFGVSAHSFDGRARYANDRDTGSYVRAIESSGSPEDFRENIDAASEFVFLGLRLSEGIALAEYTHLFGVDIRDRYLDGITRMTEAGFLELSDDRVKLTRKGMLFSNEVFAEFV